MNASTLALIDAGIPMSDYVVACTAASSASSTLSSQGGSENSDPLLDLNTLEEQELPFLTVATLGGSDKVCALIMETRMPVARLEGVLAVGVDGCAQVRRLLDQVVRKQGKKVLKDAVA
jgi:exosome complex component RRP41